MMASIDRVSPALAARLTYSLISSPPKYRHRSTELELIAIATSWRLPFQGGWLKCYRWGQGPLCLFAHSWGGRGAQPDSMIRALVYAGMTVVSFDHPAHGRSSGRKADMVRMAAAVAAVAADVGVVHTLIGHSLGVAAATFAIRDHSVDIERLVSISSFTDCLWFTNVIGDYLGISSRTLERARELASRNYQHPFNWKDFSVKHMLAGLNRPLLLIHDEQDREVPFEQGLEISRAVPAATFFATVGHGHRRVLRDQKVIEQIVEFVFRDSRNAVAATRQ